MPAARYAIFFAPTGTLLWEFGCGVFGYDPAAQAEVPMLVPDGWTEKDWRGAVAGPARYGFHATLKAPFELARGRSERELVDALNAFAAARSPFLAPPLEVRVAGEHATLMLGERSAEVDAFAAACVAAFEPFRAPLSEKDRQRRLQAQLSPRERDHLDRFGYPHVFEDFRFHMTLAGPLPQERAQPTSEALARRFAEHVPQGALEIAGLALFAEPQRGGRFKLLHEAPLGRLA